MIPGTIRLFSLWIAMGLISTPGITVISWVFYKLEVLFFSDISVWFCEVFFRSGTIRLFSLWIAMGLISTPGITVISWVFYKLGVLFFSDISVWFGEVFF